MAFRRPLYSVDSSVPISNFLFTDTSGGFSVTSTNDLVVGSLITITSANTTAISGFVSGSNYKVSGKSSSNNTHYTLSAVNGTTLTTIVGDPSYTCVVPTSGHLQEMTDTMIQQIRNQMFWKYIANPSVTLSVVGSGGNLGTIYDTRLQAGAWAQSATRFYEEYETAEPSVVNIGLSRLNQAVASLSAPDDTSSRRFPVYYTTSGDIRSMTLQDMYDTFGTSTIDALATGGQIYTISGGAVNGYSLVSGTQVFIDTRANTGAYTYNGIPEVQDQPFDVAYWYLYKRDASSVTYTPPVYVTGTDDIQTYTTSSFDSMLEEIVRYMATDVVGYRLRYNWSGSGNNCGSGMTDTRLNGAGAYTQWYVNGDDYRSQEFPDGTPVVIATHYLRETKT